MITIATPIGAFVADGDSPHDRRIGMSEVAEIEPGRAFEGVYEWSADQDDALQEAAARAGAATDLIAPGGYRIIPPERFAEVVEALRDCAGARLPTGRRIRR